MSAPVVVLGAGPTGLSAAYHLGEDALLLERDGYGVVRATDGLEALRLAREAMPDLCVLDVSMPGADGYTVCRELLDQGAGAPLVILLTAHAHTPARVSGLDAGAVDYIVKPFERQELLARVRAALRTKTARDDLLFADMHLGLFLSRVRRAHAPHLFILKRALRLAAANSQSIELRDQIFGFHPQFLRQLMDSCLSHLVSLLIATPEALNQLLFLFSTDLNAKCSVLALAAQKGLPALRTLMQIAAAPSLIPDN